MRMKQYSLILEDKKAPWTKTTRKMLSSRKCKRSIFVQTLKEMWRFLTLRTAILHNLSPLKTSRQLKKLKVSFRGPCRYFGSSVVCLIYSKGKLLILKQIFLTKFLYFLYWNCCFLTFKKILPEVLRYTPKTGHYYSTMRIRIKNFLENSVALP